MIDVSGGDLRRSITILQTVQNVVEKGEPVTEEEIVEVSGVIPSDIPRTLIEACKTKSFTKFGKEAESVIGNGYPIHELLPGLVEIISKEDSFSDVQKSKMCIAIADAERCLIDGADEWLQLLHILSVIAKSYAEN